jgi:hypothetical protein
VAAEVGAELLVDGLLDEGQVALKDAWGDVSRASSCKREIERTRLLVHGQHRDLGAGAPHGNLCGLVDQPLKLCAVPGARLELEDDAQVLGQLLDALDVLLDVGRGAVVVVEDGGEAVGDGVPGLSYPDVEGEDAVDDDKDEEVELVLGRAPDAEAARGGAVVLLPRVGGVCGIFGLGVGLFGEVVLGRGRVLAGSRRCWGRTNLDEFLLSLLIQDTVIALFVDAI